MLMGPLCILSCPPLYCMTCFPVKTNNMQVIKIQFGHQLDLIHCSTDIAL